MLTDLAGNDIRCLSNDLIYGLNKEPIVISSLSKYFNEEITKTDDKFCPYDAKSETTKYEIKSRRCKHNTFTTTIIPVHKSKAIAEENDRLVFVFNFTDGLYYIEFNQLNFNSYKISPYTIYRKGCIPKPIDHYHIPIEDLIKIDI